MTQRTQSRFRHALQLTLIAAFASLILGCGQKGPLYLPKDKPSQAQPKSKPNGESKPEGESKPAAAPKREKS